MKKFFIPAFILMLSVVLVTGCATTTDIAPQDQTAAEMQQAVEEYRLGGQGPGGGIIFYNDLVGFDFDQDGKIGEDEKNLPQNTYLAGSRFLEAAKEGWNLPVSRDDPRAEWGDDVANIREIQDVRMTLIVGESEKIRATVGNGRFNTGMIVQYLAAHTDETGTAAQLCSEYDGGGLSDWFLPSMGELVILHGMKDEVGGMIPKPLPRAVLPLKSSHRTT